MQIIQIEGCTRTIGEAQGYYGLPLRDIIVNDTVTGPDTPAMESAWLPVPVELAAILSGAPITLRVVGRAHPPVMIYVDLDKSAPDGAALIAAERRRQIDAEGWTSEHDDANHIHGELGRAAAAYVLSAIKVYQLPVSLARNMRAIIADIWPWERRWFNPQGKPDAVISRLVKAGALIAAEIDQQLRRKAKASDNG